MDAPILRFTLITLSLFISTGAGFQTPNFTVTAPTEEIASQVGTAAEEYRRDLAVFWLGQPLPNWSRPCKLRVRPGSLGAGGETKFQFVGGEVINWDMYVQGSLERILDSVLPHEVNHTIFACHFRRPLPRWADEGAATLFEHRSEQIKQLGLLNQVIDSDREFIPLPQLLSMKEYPKGYRPMLIMYAEGYALVDFLVQQGGREKYLKFLADGERVGWTRAIKENYHHAGVDSLQKNWKGWILAGMPKLKVPKGQMLASTEPSPRLGVPRPTILNEYAVGTTVRSQSPEADDDRVSTGEQRIGAEARSPNQAVARQPTERAAREAGGPVGRSRSSEAVASGTLSQERAVRGGSGVFRGLPSTSSKPVDGLPHREAVFEAPVPRTGTPSQATGSPTRSADIPIRTSTRQVPVGSRLQAATRDAPAGLEQTALGRQRASDASQNHRRHLPQERNAVTGSSPQWAGFPGQQELF
ncbi:MAG: hypothetical protein RIK87_16930 [Fuerstiella sp.]